MARLTKGCIDSLAAEVKAVIPKYAEGLHLPDDWGKLVGRIRHDDSFRNRLGLEPRSLTPEDHFALIETIWPPIAPPCYRKQRATLRSVVGDALLGLVVGTAVMGLMTLAAGGAR